MVRSRDRVGRTGVGPVPVGLKGPCSTSELTSLAFFWPVFHGHDLGFLFHDDLEWFVIGAVGGAVQSRTA